MWEEDWALLGIEPTTELAAIKKAYALKLKTTRPDDDAEAYQALRGAYERVQDWAKWQKSQTSQPTAAPVDDAPEVAPEVAPEAAPVQPDVPAEIESFSAPPAAQARLDDAMPTPPPEVPPGVLIERLELAWRQRGAPALRACWQDVRAELDAQPLHRRAEFSAQFARWVLRLPQLPDGFVAALNDYFGWLGDFRTERQIGSELVQALHQELDARLERPVGDPTLLAMAEPLRQLDAHRQQGRALSSHGLAALLQPLLARLQRQLGPSLMRRLGVDPNAQAGLQALTTRAAWLRGLLLTLIFTGICSLNGSPAGAIGARVFSWAITCLLLLGGAVLIGGLLNNGLSLVTPERRIAIPLRAWRQHRSQPFLGLGLMLLVAVATYFDPESTALLRLVGASAGDGAGWLQLLLLGFVAFAGLVLAWPLDPGHGFVSVGLSPLVISLFATWLLPWLPVTTNLMLGLTWMLLAAAVKEGRVRAPGVLEWPLRPMLNSFGLVDRWGLVLAMLPAFCALAYAMRPGEKPDGSGLFLTWVLANLAVGWLQAQAEAWALARLARAG